MLRDFYEHVLSLPDKVVQLNQQILLYTERAYNGPYFLKSIYTEHLADSMKIFPENYIEVKRLYDCAKIGYYYIMVKDTHMWKEYHQK